MITTIVDEETKKETVNQIGWLYNHRVPPYGIYLVQANRVGSYEGRLVIVKDKKWVQQVTMCDAGPSEVESVIDHARPRLEQHKHHLYTHQLGGNEVSTFAAYDKNADAYAKQLLQEAFDHYDGGTLPAKTLYVWNKKNSRYVQFMHSGNNEYHGHDELDMSKVPDSVKKVFGIWK